MNWKTVVGLGTVLGIVGFSVYAMKKYYDKQEGSPDEITIQDAMEEVRMYRESKAEEHQEEFEGMVDDCRDQASWNRSFIPDDEELIVYDSEIVSKAMVDMVKRDIEGFDSDEDTDIKGIEIPDVEEGDDLRHDNNSVEARHQFINMELSEWVEESDARLTLLKLYDFPFRPATDGDEDLRTVIIDYRVQFFGFGSRWNQDVTFADVILHYARLSSYNCDDSIRSWAEYFLEFNDLHYTMSSQEIAETLKKLNTHIYYNKELGTYGLFGLTKPSYEDAIKNANRNVDSSLTYEIEFNEFLKTTL